MIKIIFPVTKVEVFHSVLFWRYHVIYFIYAGFDVFRGFNKD
jgi:hypothetical protein